MVLHNRRRTTLSGRLLAAIVIGILALLVISSRVDAASRTAANRCSPKITSTSFSYHCWAAYPEGFSLSGHVSGVFRFDWKATCGRRVVSSSKTDGGLIHIYSGILSRKGKERAAYEMMINHDVCKYDIDAKPIAGNGAIQLLEFFVNRNDPKPILFHN
ncbi:MAG: hypothetical protein Q7R60_00615 [bacterium]|nr:hypothetical protein [bacterium]